MFLTEKRIELLDALLRCDNISEAALELGIPTGTARQRLYKLRKAVKSIREDLKLYGKYRLQMPTKYLKE